MTPGDLDLLRAWFDDFCGSYHVARAEDQRNILLKEEHTRRVCENMRRLAGDCGLNEGQALLAEAIALFHDVGRFPQYAQYRTFSDALSVNHAVLGARILAERKVLARLSEREQEMVLQAVKFHNVFAVPDWEDHEASLFLRLIRDADKLDIWRVFADYYELPAAERASAAGLGLPGGTGPSAAVLASVFEGRVVALSSMKTLDDFKLLQLSWIYDLHFDSSLRSVLAGDSVERIARTLPDSEEARQVLPFLHAYIRRRLREGGR